MKIGNPTDKPVASPAPVTNGRTAPTAAGQTQTAAIQQSGAAAEASTQVELSSAATQLMSSTTGVPGDFDAEKVSRIAQAISEGKFQVNATAIADKLLSNARELLGSAQH